MNLRTRLSRSNGYRELGMFDESILELEAIDGDDRWHPLVVEARYNTYRDAKEWEMAKTMANAMYERKTSSFKWLRLRLLRPVLKFPFLFGEFPVPACRRGY